MGGKGGGGGGDGMFGQPAMEAMAESIAQAHPGQFPRLDASGKPVASTPTTGQKIDNDGLSGPGQKIDNGGLGGGGDQVPSPDQPLGDAIPYSGNLTGLGDHLAAGLTTDPTKRNAIAYSGQV